MNFAAVNSEFPADSLLSIAIAFIFKCMFSVLNHLPAFGGYFYGSERFCRNALMPSLILAFYA